MENNIIGSLNKNEIGVLIKGTHNCNLNCEYCYDRFARAKHGANMTEEILHKTIDRLADYSTHVNLIWHGGEPLSLPLSFYSNVQDYIFSKYKTNFTQDMQSNGTLLTPETEKQLKDLNIQVGISYDSQINSIRNGTEKYDMKKKFKEIQQNYGNCGTITVINNNNIDKIIDVYKDLYDTGIRSMSFNTIFPTEENSENSLVMEVDNFGNRFKELISFLYFSKSLPIERTSKLFLEIIYGEKHKLCSHRDCRYIWLGIEPNGDIYPCDREYPEKYKMGNVMTNSIEEAFNSNGYTLYALEIEEKYKKHCYNCDYFFFCNGGCNANSIAKYGTAAELEKDHCAFFKRLFNETYFVSKNIDLFDENLNTYIKNFIYQTKKFTMKEIKKSVLEMLKYEIPDTSFGDDIFQTIEYKIFRLYNPLDGEYDLKEHLNVSSNVSQSFNVSDIKQEDREEFVNKITNSIKTNILDIINKEK